MPVADPKAAPFKVRPARRGDAPGIVAILNEAGAAADTQTFTWIISHPEVEVLVAADPLDKVIGVVSLSHRPLLKVGGRAASIDELGVARAWIRKGVGRELLKRAVERARVLGVKRLEVQTFAGVTDEVDAFFRATGFERANVGVFRLK
ncbi:MAG: GNAT family N-acetyltransferase [Myxococcaceae bacterium]|nr:GNAT family N-acetyltransferase [Myxococcaceae bacterium]